MKIGHWILFGLIIFSLIILFLDPGEPASKYDETYRPDCLYDMLYRSPTK